MSAFQNHKKNQHEVEVEAFLTQNDPYHPNFSGKEKISNVRRLAGTLVKNRDLGIKQGTGCAGTRHLGFDFRGEA